MMLNYWTKVDDEENVDVRKNEKIDEILVKIRPRVPLSFGPYTDMVSIKWKISPWLNFEFSFESF